MSQSSPEDIVRRLEWTVIRRLDGLLQGDYRTLFRGFGLDLADLREYQTHDDVRHIDWNVTARTQTPYVREHIEDREVTGWLLLDLSASMDFGSGGVAKRALLTDFSALMARLLTRRGNRIGAVLFSGGVDSVVPARGGRRHVLHLLQTLTGRPASSHAAPTDLGRLLSGAAQVVRRRSLVFVVSDFISAPGWEQGLAQLARRHEVLAVRLVDPMERRLPDVGMVVMQDAETGEQLFVETGDRSLRRRFAEAADRREAELSAAFEKAGVDVLELSTDEDLGEAVLRFAAARTRRVGAPLRAAG